jgi:hypothetical protein
VIVRVYRPLCPGIVDERCAKNFAGPPEVADVCSPSFDHHTLIIADYRGSSATASESAGTIGMRSNRLGTLAPESTPSRSDGSARAATLITYGRATSRLFSATSWSTARDCAHAADDPPRLCAWFGVDANLCSERRCVR